VASGSAAIEKEKSSDDSRTHDEEFSDVESPPEDDDGAKTPPPPVLAAQDVNMSPQNRDDGPYDPDGSDHDGEHGGSDNSGPEDSDDDEEDNFPACFPDDPPFVKQIPTIEYPVDAPRSSPSARNLDFNRMVQDNFVPFAKGMKGDIYRKRTNYEHQKVMG